MERRFEFGDIGETPSIEVVKLALILGGLISVFVEEGVGGGGDSLGDAEGLGDSFAELGFADSELALESKNEGVFARHIKIFFG